LIYSPFNIFTLWQTFFIEVQISGVAGGSANGVRMTDVVANVDTVR
jgi:hypothetical protein